MAHRDARMAAAEACVPALGGALAHGIVSHKGEGPMADFQDLAAVGSATGAKIGSADSPPVTPALSPNKGNNAAAAPKMTPRAALKVATAEAKAIHATGTDAVAKHRFQQHQHAQMVMQLQRDCQDFQERLAGEIQIRESAVLAGPYLCSVSCLPASHDRTNLKLGCC